MAAIRMALYGTKHPHAAGKLKAIQDDPDVAFAGAFEADPEQRRTLEALEVAIGMRESHRRGNVRVDLPIADRSLKIEAFA